MEARGSKGGKGRAAKMTPEERSKSAREAAKSAFQNPYGVERCEQREDGFRQGLLCLGCVLTCSGSLQWRF